MPEDADSESAVWPHPSSSAVTEPTTARGPVITWRPTVAGFIGIVSPFAAHYGLWPAIHASFYLFILLPTIPFGWGTYCLIAGGRRGEWFTALAGAWAVIAALFVAVQAFFTFLNFAWPSSPD